MATFFGKSCSSSLSILTILFPVLVLRAGFGLDLITSVPDLCIEFTFIELQ